MNKGLTMNSRRILKLFPFYFFVMMFLLAVGCSSGSAEQDRDVAEAGVTALLRAIET